MSLWCDDFYVTPQGYLLHVDQSQNVSKSADFRCEKMHFCSSESRESRIFGISALKTIVLKNKTKLFSTCIWSISPVLTAPVSTVSALFATVRARPGPFCPVKTRFQPPLEAFLTKRNGPGRARTVANRAGTALMGAVRTGSHTSDRGWNHRDILVNTWFIMQS